MHLSHVGLIPSLLILCTHPIDFSPPTTTIPLAIEEMGLKIVKSGSLRVESFMRGVYGSLYYLSRGWSTWIVLRVGKGRIWHLTISGPFYHKQHSHQVG